MAGRINSTVQSTWLWQYKLLCCLDYNFRFIIKFSSVFQYTIIIVAQNILPVPNE